MTKNVINSGGFSQDRQDVIIDDAAKALAIFKHRKKGNYVAGEYETTKEGVPVSMVKIWEMVGGIKKPGALYTGYADILGEKKVKISPKLGNAVEFYNKLSGSVVPGNKLKQIYNIYNKTPKVSTFKQKK